MKIYLPFLLTVCLSCSQPPASTENIHIVPNRKRPEINQPDQPPPPPPAPAYLPSNFIIDTEGQVYFYQQQKHGWFCGTGISWDTPPEFIDLKPNDLVKVPISGIEDFIKLNIILPDSNNRLVAIASIKDTINSVGLTRIFKVFKDQVNKIKWTFRKATQEEAIVLDYKQNNRNYYPDYIQWDSTKIRFAPGLESNTLFTPPKVEDE